MPARLQPPEEFELLRRSSFDSADDSDFDTRPLPPSHRRKSGLASQLSQLLSSFLKSGDRPRTSKAYTQSRRGCCRRRAPRAVIPVCGVTVGVVVLLVILTAIFNPSYTSPPAHYQELRHKADQTGLANPNNEKVFIAANIIDEDLIRGAWGKAVLDLIDLLGQENVFLSVYENDSGEGTTAALTELEERVKCNSSIISEHLPLEFIPTVALPSGRQRIKRVAYLAEVRNKALAPLDVPSKSPRAFNKHTSAAHIPFDKILFLNDVIFSPLDAAQLLFSTNVHPTTGQTNYRAACAVDFINPFKFYDTFATRDLGGYSMGVPFFPWFSNAGNAESRQDVLAGKDAVRVRSCWGGMVAFEAKWFQQLGLSSGETDGAGGEGEDEDEDEDVEDGEDRNLNWHLNGSTSISPRDSPKPPIRFRAEPDTFWDASECCLIHADLQSLPPTFTANPPAPSSSSTTPPETGIYLNPFIRVSYSSRTFNYLHTTRRFERLYTFPHHLVNKLVGLPWSNPRRAEIAGQDVQEKVWVYDDPEWMSDAAERAKEAAGGKLGVGKRPKKMKGRFEVVTRTAGTGGFCGVRKLSVLKEERREGERMWEDLPVPPG
ncbi:MAG: hypothetical protein M1817_001210 [Caeruleum heppii]|nr:MAG: hypothetical protein M1817_001210 [Caeruleum heppii]